MCVCVCVCVCVRASAAFSLYASTDSTKCAIEIETRGLIHGASDSYEPSYGTRDPKKLRLKLRLVSSHNDTTGRDDHRQTEVAYVYVPD